jgi:antitoxin ParD1/3/4
MVAGATVACRTVLSSAYSANTKGPTMPTRNVVLSDPQEALIRDLVASGRYQNASEVLRAGLRLLEDREASLEAVRAGLRAGLDQAADGTTLEGEAAIAEAFEAATRASATDE